MMAKKGVREFDCDIDYAALGTEPFIESSKGAHKEAVLGKKDLVWKRLNKPKIKEDITEYLRQQEVEQELAECSFQPRISKVSNALVTKYNSSKFDN